MKLFILFAFTLLAQNALADWRSESMAVLNKYKAECRTTEVKVEEIVKNDHISGRVSGLPTDAFKKFKVIVYVKSNRWYIHPYENGGDGFSYSSLNSRGEFLVRSVLRVPSKKLAALLVPKQVIAKNQSQRFNPLFGLFGGLTKYKCAYSIADGNGDFLIPEQN